MSETKGKEKGKKINLQMPILLKWYKKKTVWNLKFDSWRGWKWMYKFWFEQCYKNLKNRFKN